MNNVLTNLRPARIFLGVPQTDKIQVYKVTSGRSAVITQAVLTNTKDEETAITLTINTIDVMRKFTVSAGETKVIDLYIVLNEEDTVSLQQDVENAVNVTLNGGIG